MCDPGGAARYARAVSTFGLLSDIRDYVDTSGRVTFESYMNDGVFKIADFLNIAQE